MGVSTTHRINLSMWILMYSFSDTYYVWAACAQCLVGKHQLVALSIQAKILQISARNQMELTISVRSNRNIWNHLWRWSTLTGLVILVGRTEISLSIYSRSLYTLSDFLTDTQALFLDFIKGEPMCQVKQMTRSERSERSGTEKQQ